MHIFLSPRITTGPFAADCQLVDISSEKLGLFLQDGIDIVGRRPMPNKSYLVACRKVGRTAINGIIINTKAHVESFDLVTRWRINDDILVKHTVNYTVLDDEYDTVTENMVLWNAHSKALGLWGRRWPEQYTQPPVHHQPRFTLQPRGDEAPGIERVNGNIVEEFEQDFVMHTVELQRLTESVVDRRLPKLADAFIAAI